jgi:hypothetical protein
VSRAPSAAPAWAQSLAARARSSRWAGTRPAST